MAERQADFVFADARCAVRPERARGGILCTADLCVFLLRRTANGKPFPHRTGRGDAGPHGPESAQSTAQGRSDRAGNSHVRHAPDGTRKTVCGSGHGDGNQQHGARGRVVYRRGICDCADHKRGDTFQPPPEGGHGFGGKRIVAAGERRCVVRFLRQGRVQVRARAAECSVSGIRGRVQKANFGEFGQGVIYFFYNLLYITLQHTHIKNAIERGRSLHHRFHCRDCMCTHDRGCDNVDGRIREGSEIRGYQITQTRHAWIFRVDHPDYRCRLVGGLHVLFCMLRSIMIDCAA